MPTHAIPQPKSKRFSASFKHGIFDAKRPAPPPISCNGITTDFDLWLMAHAIADGRQAINEWTKRHNASPYIMRVTNRWKYSGPNTVVIRVTVTYKGYEWIS